MNETWCRLIEGLLQSALRRVSLDVVHLNEDMAYRIASMVGKPIFDEFIAPYYQRIRRIVEEYGVPESSRRSKSCGGVQFDSHGLVGECGAPNSGELP